MVKRVFILFIVVMLLLVSARAMAEPNIVWYPFGGSIFTSQPYNESEYNNTWTCFGCSIFTSSSYSGSEPNTTWNSFGAIITIKATYSNAEPNATWNVLGAQIFTSTPYSDNETNCVWQSFGVQIDVAEILICNYFVNVSINSSYVDNDLVDFPVLIPINSTISAKCDGGKSIRFNNSDNTSQFKYEIEGDWNSSNTNYVWVKISRVDRSSNTLVWVRYNNSNATDNQQPSRVWNSDYAGVWHMNDYSNTQINDSTSNANHGTKSASTEPDEEAGIVGYAQFFDGDDYIDANSVSDDCSGGSLTIECWCKRNGAPVSSESTLSFNTAIKGNRFLSFITDTGVFRFYYNAIGYDSIHGIADNSYHYTVSTVNSGNDDVYLYVDNNVGEKQTDTSETAASNDLFSMGQEWDAGRSNYLTGYIDEVRISGTDRNSSWIETTYYTISQATNFLIWGEIGGGGGTGIDVSVAPDIWTIGNIVLNTCCQNNFTFWQNGTTLIDITIGISGTNYTFVNYTEWLANGHNRFYGNVTNNSWSTETNIEDSVPSITLINQSFTGQMLFGVRLWMPRTTTSQKDEDFDIVLTVTEST